MVQSDPASSAGPGLAAALASAQRGLRFRRELLMNQPAGPSDLTRPLLDAVAMFDELNIAYALIGGLASMVYGAARHTIDVDFVAASDHEAILASHPDAMQAHGFDPACTWKLYHQSGVAIDLWKDQHADDIASRAQVHQLGGRDIRVAEPHDLIAMKLRADRPQDDYDIAEVLQHQRIDDDVLHQRITPEQFQRFAAIRRRVQQLPHINPT